MNADPDPDRRPLTYSRAGVDVERGNSFVDAIRPLVKATARAGADGEIGGFGGVFDLRAAGFDDPLLVAANDGVGTKVKIAIETGIHHTVGIDLVAMCVNDLVVQGAEPLFFLDYYATGQLDATVGTEIVKGIVEGCRQAGCALIGGETAEMPGLYANSDYDLAGFAVGAVERGSLLPRGDIAEGDLLIGLPSSGVHSNGFSLVRRLVADLGLDWTAQAPFAAHPLGEALLEPTRIYVRPILAAIAATGAVKALAHITGGGLTENLPRALTGAVAAEIDLSAIPFQPVFNWISGAGNVMDDEMLRTFNCGIGMIAIASQGKADRVIDALSDHGEKPRIIGRLGPRGSGAAVRFSGRLGG